MCLLALNGRRISEALGATSRISTTSADTARSSCTARDTRPPPIPLAPRTATSLDLYIGERTSGPIFLNADGDRRLDRHAAARIVRRLAKAAGIDKRISPHSLRHSFITAALDAGVPLRDVQEAASHADPRTTMRYDRGRGSLDRHATYIVATFVAGVSRSPSAVRARHRRNDRVAGSARSDGGLGTAIVEHVLQVRTVESVMFAVTTTPPINPARRRSPTTVATRISRALLGSAMSSGGSLVGMCSHEERGCERRGA